MKMLYKLLITSLLIFTSASTSVTLKANLEDITSLVINDDNTVIVYSSNEFTSNFSVIQADINKYNEISYIPGENLPVFHLKQNKTDPMFAVLVQSYKD